MKITVQTPKTDPRIIIESEYGKAIIRPADLMHSEVLILNIFTAPREKVLVEMHDA